MTDITPSEVEQATQGRYEVLSLIGEGGMGAVFLARHRELGSRVAIKILPPEVRFTPDRLARFRREAALSAQMSHPHVVPTFECSVEGDIAFLIMPYVDGVPLDRYLDEHGRMSWGEVKRLITEIGSALTFAHNRGIVHRDIKPANILFERETGRWLLTDFGVAHVAVDTATLTHSGASLGTPAYMAPEQLGGAAEVDARADLYALAVVAIEALTGERPQPMAGLTDLSDAVSARRPDLPTGAARVLAAPIAVARDERPESVEEWLGSLERRPRRPRWYLGAAAAVAVLMVWGGRGLLRDSTISSAEDPPVVAVLPFAVTGTVPGVNLGYLPDAFTWQLQALRGYEVLQPSAVRSQVVRRFGAGPFTVDSLREMADAVEADQVLIGEVTAGESAVAMRIQLYDPAQGQMIAAARDSAPADSLHVLVSGLVIEVFATRLAREQTGLPAQSLPRGVPAVGALFEGDQALRRAAYHRAKERFETVIELDPMYAPAYWKRILATVLEAQPSKAGPAVQSALQEALSVRGGLDPVTDSMLTAYTTLLVDGDVHGAEQQLESVTYAHPDAIDAWFLLGFLRGWFAPFLGIDLGPARFALGQAVTRDPSFAAAIAYLAQAALLENDLEALRDYMGRYLAVDSVSEWAELLRVGDTLVFHAEHANRVLRSFPNRSARILEYLSLGAAAVSQPGGTRPFAIAALEELAERATTPGEVVTTFRMRMAVHLGAWQIRDARRVLQETQAIGGVPRSEIDRWIVLIEACDLEDSLSLGDATDAAQRLLRTGDEAVVSAWLAARWARRSGANRQPFDDRFNELTSGDSLSPLERSLRADLTALDYAMSGDTTRALETWEDALTHVSVTEVLFGLVASLWPLRLDRARLALASGRPDVATTAAESFLQIGGFTDQVAWVPALSIAAEARLARSDTTRAQDAYRDVYRLLALADDEGLAIRDSIGTLLRSWRR